MEIQESILIDATLERVWETFTDLTCWKDWSKAVENVSSGAGKISQGKSFRFCIRPFAFPVNVQPFVEEVIPGRRIVWSARKHGIHARHEFTFQVNDGKVFLTSRETFSSSVMKILTLFLPERKMRQLLLLMLRELKEAAEVKGAHERHADEKMWIKRPTPG